MISYESQNQCYNEAPALSIRILLNVVSGYKLCHVGIPFLTLLLMETFDGITFSHLYCTFHPIPVLRFLKFNNTKFYIYNLMFSRHLFKKNEMWTPTFRGGPAKLDACGGQKPSFSVDVING